MSEKSKTQPPKTLIVKEVASNVPAIPDEHTKKDPVFFDGGAPNQVFKFERWGIAYGTDDKGHAAAIILSVMLVVILSGVFLGGFFVERSWIPDALKLLGTSFTFVAGVAIGKSIDKK